MNENTHHDSDLAALVDRIPPGWSEVGYHGRRWGLRRTDHVGGRTVAIQAEELGGTGWVSTNVLQLTDGPLLKPCEMPAEQVLAFLQGWAPLRESRTAAGDPAVDSDSDIDIDIAPSERDGETEVPLAGGNMGGAVRVGSTVRRSSGPWSATVQRLLRHLRAAGLTWVPEPLGVDERGRDVTSHLPGTVPGYPLPSWIWSDEILVSATRFLVELHRASASFVSDDAVWQLPSHPPVEVICHNDFAPYNMVFRDRQLTGVIDWDTASPGSRVWDVAYLAYRLVPLSVPDLADDAAVRERARRLRALTTLYGHGLVPADVVTAAVARVRDLAAFTQERAVAGRPDLHDHVVAYHRDIRWMVEHAERLTAAPPR